MDETKRSRHAREQQRYRQKYPERVAASNKAYYEKNREAIQKRLKANRDTAGEKARGSLIRQHRQSLGKNQQKYAAALGITQATLSLWENGKVPINLFTIDSVFPELGDQLRNEERK